MRSIRHIFITVILFCGFFSQGLPAQVVDWISPEALIPSGCAYDQFGNSYTFGQFSNTVTVGGTSFTSAGFQDQIIIKFGPAGNVIWATAIGSSGVDYPGDIVYDGVGNVWVTGETEGNLNAGSFSLTNNGSGDPYLVKLSASTGTVLFASNGGGSGDDDGNDIATDGAGNVYVVGDCRSSNFSWGGFNMSVSGSIDVFVVKFNNAGTPQWLSTISGPNWEFTYTATADPAGNCYVGGMTTSSSSVYNGTTVQNGTNGQFIAKFDSSGNFVWTAQYDAGGNIYGITADDWGNVYFTAAGGPGTFGPITIPASNGGGDILLGKVNQTGTFSWAKLFGGTGYDEGNGVDCDRDGNVFLAGWFEATMNMGGIPLTANSGRRGVVSKLDSAGNVIWALASRAQSFSQYFKSVQVNGSNDLWVAGHGGGYIVLGDDSVTVPSGFNIRMADSANVIKGKVFADANNNGSLDAGEAGIPNTILQLGSSSYVTASNSVGNYEFYTYPGTYSVSIPNIPLYHTLTTSATQSATFAGMGGRDTANHFGLYPTPNINDLRLDVTPITRPKAGRVLSYLIYYRNVGTTSQNVTLTMQGDANLTYVFAFPSPASQSGNVFTWNLGTVPPQGIGTVNIYFDVPTTMMIGDTLVTSATLDPVTGDQVPADNVYSQTSLVVGPYDPNYKAVNPEELYNISGPSWLTYEVHFQNLGNAEAEDVRIIDTLPTAHLDLTSLEVVSSSHLPMQLSVEDGNVAKFFFPGIQLPDSATDPVGSNGFVKFRIKQDGSLPLNQAIGNFADIYFDYNPPIRTDTAYTWHLMPVGLKDQAFSGKIQVYPNPTTGNFAIDLGGMHQEVHVTVFGLDGQLLSSRDYHGTQFVEHTMDVPAGAYMVLVEADGERAVLRVVVE